MKTIPAGVSKKTGKPYNSFTACPNRCQSPQQPRFNPSPDAFKSPTSNQDGQSILADEVIALKANFNERMDNMSKYLVKEIEFIKTILTEMLGGEDKK
jgi:hypothetical protein